MSRTNSENQPARVTVVGGGLAGMAAAAALVRSGCKVELFEARSRLGGRAGSFEHQGQTLDHCQHVSMGCCTNLAHFATLTETAALFETFPSVWFLAESGTATALKAGWGLPAPLHLFPSFCKMPDLSWRDRYAIARGVGKLVRTRPEQLDNTQPMSAWLASAGQTPSAIERWWQVVLVSSLSETLDRISTRYARQVLREGFLTTRHSHVLALPKVPLDELYGNRVADWLAQQGVMLRLATPVKAIEGNAAKATTLRLAGGAAHPVDWLVVALPWRPVVKLFSPELQSPLRDILHKAEQIPSSPITSVHLWFDRPILQLPHAVLTGRLSQWIFRRPGRSNEQAQAGHYYQVVISASRALKERTPTAIVDEVLSDLHAVLPESRSAQLLASQLITQPEAVFSVVPGIDALRPGQQTPVANVLLAGDWTQTRWPATMEGAVRSGYLAAEALLRTLGSPRRWLQEDLRPAALTRLFFPW